MTPLQAWLNRPGREAPGMDRVVACLSERTRSRMEIAQDLKLSYGRVVELLNRLQALGWVREDYAEGSGGVRGNYRYTLVIGGGMSPQGGGEGAVVPLDRKSVV